MTMISFAVRYLIDDNPIDYLVKMTDSGQVLDVTTPYFDLPPAARKLMLRKAGPQTEASIKARGQYIHYQIALILAGIIRGTDEYTIVNEMSVQGINDSNPDPPKQWFRKKLGLPAKAAAEEIAFGKAFLAVFDAHDNPTTQHFKKLCRDKSPEILLMFDELFPLLDAANHQGNILAQLSRRKLPGARDFFLKRLNSPNNERWAHEAVKALMPYADEAIFPALQANLQSSESPDVRTLVAVTRWIAANQYHDGLPLLWTFLDSTNLKVVKAAAKALLAMNIPNQSLLERANERRLQANNKERIAAWGILESISTYETKTDKDRLWDYFIEDTIRYPLASIAYSAPVLLSSKFGSGLLYQRLLTALSHENTSVRCGMLFLLERLKNRFPELLDEAGIIRICRLLEDPDGNVRRMVSQMLSSMLRREVSPDLITLLLDIYQRHPKRMELRLSIVGCFVVLFQHNDYDLRIEPILLEALNASDRSLRLSVFRLLLKTPSAATREQLRKARAAGVLQKR